MTKTTDRILNALKAGPKTSGQLDRIVPSSRRYITDLRRQGIKIYKENIDGQEFYQIAEQVTNDYVTPDATKKLKNLLATTEMTVADICKEYSWGPEFTYKAIETLRGQDVPIQEIEVGRHSFYTVPEVKTIHKSVTKLPQNSTELAFGLVSDTHLSSNVEMMPQLESAYDEFASRGLKTVLHAGDLLDGRGIYSGQDINLKQKSSGGQIAHLIRDYPRRKGITTYVCAGNHDVWKREKIDPIAKLRKELKKAGRNDIQIIGQYNTRMEIGGVRIDMMHPAGGLGNTTSHKMEHLFRTQYAGTSDFPQIFVLGHLHVAHNIGLSRGVEGVYGGTFQGRTDFMERLGLIPSHAFWNIFAQIDSARRITRWKPEKITHNFDNKLELRC